VRSHFNLNRKQSLRRFDSQSPVSSYALSTLTRLHPWKKAHGVARGEISYLQFSLEYLISYRDLKDCSKVD
jgi:hypothetical protein